MSEQDWVLRGKWINELVQESLAETVRIASACSITDIQVRVNGEWKRFEADWVKYLEPLQPPAAPAVSHEFMITRYELETIYSFTKKYSGTKSYKVNQILEAALARGNGG